jgi:hypothetical protein
MVRVPERQQPKAQAHSEKFSTEDIDEKTCRKRQVLGDSESAEKLERLAAVRSFYHEELAGNSEAGDNRLPIQKVVRSHLSSSGHHFSAALKRCRIWRTKHLNAEAPTLE